MDYGHDMTSIDRRTLLQSGLAATLGMGLVSTTPAQQARSDPAQPGVPSLRSEFHGCIAGVYVGSAMGAPIEGWRWEEIEKEYGTLDRLLPYHHYEGTTDWVREPGTTEDGVERQKLMIRAILDKKDRVSAEMDGA